jgi:hypothetical protein
MSGSAKLIDKINHHVYQKETKDWVRWLMPAIPALQEVKIRRITANLGKKFSINKPGMVVRICDPSYARNYR